ncbi:conserved exported hypothetical protein [Alteromonas sp. 38]|uniref:hypothetical protein n=1 Tax=unclassified Alteromonas TaxID=2614992 RepID=UPI0012F01CDE|nr:MULTISPECIES: hypothetical protein [unclassified Alteromonas]CAD5280604.1 conserved exported hypothetical protein [Alteromonas sp. 154]VXB81122.1 conserved exported hypothetical protein [Alteromonas sp. 38]
MKYLLLISTSFLLTACYLLPTQHPSPWLVIDTFDTKTLTGWQLADTQNDTTPFLENAQVTEIRVQDSDSASNSIKDTSSTVPSVNNGFLFKKPAPDGVVGNRKALTFKALPQPIPVGETYSFYTRIRLERFPNNHAFGISNMHPADIIKHGYNAFEPTLRVTDKAESNGFKNNGSLMVKIDSEDKYRQYASVKNTDNNKDAKPLKEGVWYSIWYVVNNATVKNGGQVYRVYVKGGEFSSQSLVYENANFRMKRELPLIYFLANCNTGPIKQPYGNGGLAYDDIYMSEGINLTVPF